MTPEAGIDIIKTDKKRRPLFGRRAITFMILIIAEVALVVAVFGVGYKIGQDVGRKDAAVAAGLNGINSLLGNISNPFRSATGKTEAITKDSITIETTSGEKKTAKITANTKITRRSEVKAAEEIKKGMRVSVFFDESASEPTATRIVINE